MPPIPRARSFDSAAAGYAANRPSYPPALLDAVEELAHVKQADAFITHAGAGGSQEGLATGTPMVAVPQAVDQFGNADMLQSLGVARHVPMDEVTPERLREAVLALVSDPDVTRRSREIQEQTAREGGTPRAADLIEGEVPRRLPVHD